jgi:phosphatidylserine/phosphatidylglycerophosphate/cardiolipin synthase-like enzyme
MKEILQGFFILATGILVLAVPGAWAQVPCVDFELVESIPAETTLDDPEIRNTAEVWLEMIRGAGKTLDIEQFYISNEPGEPLEEVIAAIEEAARRGVKVRVIVEKKRYITYPETVDRLGKQPGIEARILDFSQIRPDGVQHAKFIVVDAEQVFVGSQNFDWRALKHIHEIGVRIRHRQAAAAFLDLFDLDWRLCKVESPGSALEASPRREYLLPFEVQIPGKSAIQFYPVWAPGDLSPNKDLWSLAAILKMLDGAKESIEVELLNYSPIARDKTYWPELEVALRSAAARGVNVRMIVADWNKTHPKIDYLKSLTLVPNIEVRLSTIPPYSGGHIPYARVTHAKFMAVDGRHSWIGCSNWEKSYYYNTRDAGVAVDSEEVAVLLRGIFERDWGGGYVEPLRPEVEYEPPRVGE